MYHPTRKKKHKISKITLLSEKSSNSNMPSKEFVDNSTQTIETSLKQFNPKNAPEEAILDTLKFLDANESEKCKLICKKWSQIIGSNISRLPTGLPQVVDFDSNGKISYITKRQNLPRNKISKISVYLTSEMLSKFEKSTTCQLVKIRVKFMYVYIWESSRLALMNDFLNCFMADFVNISLDPPEVDFLIKHPKFVPLLDSPTKMTICLRNKTQTICSVAEIIEFIMYPKFPSVNRHSLQFDYMDQEKSIQLIEKLYELFQADEEIGRFFTRFDFQTLEWNTIQKIQDFSETEEMEKTVISDGETDAFHIVRYATTRATDNWAFRIEFTDDDVSINIVNNN